VARAVQHELVDRETRLPHARPGPARARSLEERGLNAVKLVSQKPGALQTRPRPTRTSKRSSRLRVEPRASIATSCTLRSTTTKRSYLTPFDCFERRRDSSCAAHVLRAASTSFASAGASQAGERPGWARDLVVRSTLRHAGAAGHLPRGDCGRPTARR